jgi:hypothetical protein
LQSQRPNAKAGTAARLSREAALQAWKHIARALAHSGSQDDRRLARQIVEFVKDMPMLRTASTPARETQRVDFQTERTQVRPEIER